MLCYLQRIMLKKIAIVGKVVNCQVEKRGKLSTSNLFSLPIRKCSWLEKPRAAAECASSPPPAWPPDSRELAPPLPMLFSTVTIQTRRWNRQQSICCLWKKAVYKTCQRKRGRDSWKGRDTVLGVSFLWGLSLWWHRNELIAMNACMKELGCVMCKVCSWTHFPLLFPRG